MEGEKGLEHGKTCVRLKNELDKSPSAKPEVFPSLWDLNESDTESLIQERAYQLELQKRIGESVEQNMTNSLEEDRREEHQDEGGHQIYDSLEISAQDRQSINNNRLSPFKVQLQNRDKEVSRRTRCEDTSAELRYDPNWRINLESARPFDEITSQLPPKDEGEQSRRRVERREELSGRSGYRYISDTHRSVLVDSLTPETTSRQPHSKHPLTSYHLHQKQNQAAREVSPESLHPLHLHHDELGGEMLPESTCQSPGSPSETATERNSHLRVKAGSGVVRSLTNVICGESQSRSANLEEYCRETHDRHDGELQIYRDEEQRGTGQYSGTVAEKPSQTLTVSKSKELRRASNRKPREDIVERNRATLGVNAAKRGSYLRAHTMQKEMKTHGLNQVSASTEDIAIIGNQEEDSLGDNIDPEWRWLQKTQQLKISKEKTVQRTQNPKPPSEKRPIAQVGRAIPVDNYVTNTPRPAARTQPRPDGQPQHSPTLQELSDTGSQCSTLDNWPCPRQTQPVPNVDDVLTSTSLGSPCTGPGPQWNSQNIKANRTLRNTTLIHPYSYRSPQPYPQEQVLIPQAAGPPTSPGWGSRSGPGFPVIPSLSEEPSNLINRQNTPWQSENHMVVQYEDGRSPTSTYAAQMKLNSGSYPVLPPIGKPTGDPQLVSDRAPQMLTCMKRSSSDGYLAQMLTEKQPKERVTYKAYTLMDYKQLMQDIKLGGLGPDYATTEITGEKIRRQKLYSNVIREQNKKISRIPCLPAARNPVGSDNKDNMVPRRKALEYARSIPRPKVVLPSGQPKPREPERNHEENQREPERNHEDVKRHIDLLEGFNQSQLATLESLTKRHEREKQIVASLKLMHSA